MDNFDWEKYINYYDDLRLNGIKNKKNAINHYLKYGKKAGRKFFFKKESKLIIIPSYKDLYKLKKWEKILKNKNYLIYEKDDNLEFNNEVKISNNHIKIFSYGEGTIQFLYYLIKNYDNIPDYIIYTKMNWLSPPYGTVELFEKDYRKKKLYFQHSAQRYFLTFHTKSEKPEDFKNELKKFLLENDKNFFKKYKLIYNEKVLEERNECPVSVFKKHNRENFKLENDFDKKFNSYNNVIIDPSWLKYKWLNEMMDMFFIDYNPISEFKLHCRDAAFTVHKNIIYYHKKYKYEKLFNSYLNNNICRDEICIFINLLFYETLKRFNKNN